jgi:glutamate---cysteine ligase / carboxylate-amine ligase
MMGSLPTAHAPHELRAFEAFGLEIHYMLVDAASLDVASIADRVLMLASGAAEPVNEATRGELAWSNELVLHVLELKNPSPTPTLSALAPRLQEEAAAMNLLLAPLGARLMPAGMHPWMNPTREARIWPHGHAAAVYQAHERIFGCRSHGWANLQSTNLNLPFGSDEEFARLHAAARAVVPIIPALCASSPYVEGRAPGLLDCRMEAYRTNADAMPSLRNPVIPEPASSRAQYEREILEPLHRAIAPHDPERLLQQDWLNARGVIPRFGRGALEIRVADVQECPQADLAHAAMIIDLVQWLYERRFTPERLEHQLSNRALVEIFMSCVRDAERARVSDPDYLALFRLRGGACEAGELWSAAAEALDRAGSAHLPLWRRAIEYTLARGTLARRLLRATGPRPSPPELYELYRALCEALQAGARFDP